jgi:TRAP-type C4-dicarboxylate transport system permease small subunit
MARIETWTWFGARILASAGLVCLLAFACATLSDGLLRALANAPIEAVRDLGPVVVAACMSACFPLAILEKSNIRIHLLASTLGARATGVLETIVEIMTLLVLAAMARQLFIYAGNMLEGGDSTVMLEVPLAPFWYFVAIMMSVAVLAQAVMLAAHGRSTGSMHRSSANGGHP